LNLCLITSKINLPGQLNILLSRLMVKLLTENMSNFLIVKSKSKSGSHVGKTEQLSPSRPFAASGISVRDDVATSLFSVKSCFEEKKLLGHVVRCWKTSFEGNAK
jgi:hypothetical protein